jgi:hypothetical protein
MASIEPTFTTPSFITTGRHLLMRYEHGSSFSFDNVRLNATDEGLMNLANAFASIQEHQPSGVYAVVTRLISL